ncbi:Dabb family protein [Gorillibacterium timonense]|uniref:Dabb family protein n=1 Tax=Gorillibacterium timonense TaxID=1689269 RepID=UPI00071CD92A|nr:Dabb family protein [Gorillibacterium timonense]
MITHLVFFRMKDTSSEGLAKTRDLILDLKDKIPDVLHMEVGVNVVAQSRAYDLALITKFPSLAALDAYQVHPEHLKLIEYMNEARREPSVSVDFES